MSAVQSIDEYLRNISFSPVLWLPKQEFSKRFGVSIPTIDGKIRANKWQEGKEYIRDPDGKTHISVIEYQRWVESTWRQQEGKEAQYRRIAESSFCNSGGTTPSKVQQKSTGGPSKQVKRQLKVIKRS